jgi:hypothetical protein
VGFSWSREWALAARAGVELFLSVLAASLNPFSS